MKSRCTHRFTNRSNRPDLSLFAALTLWEQKHVRREEKHRGGEHMSFILYVLFFQLIPLFLGGLVVQRRPGQKVAL